MRYALCIVALLLVALPVVAATPDRLTKHVMEMGSFLQDTANLLSKTTEMCQMLNIKVTSLELRIIDLERENKRLETEVQQLQVTTVKH